MGLFWRQSSESFVSGYFYKLVNNDRQLSEKGRKLFSALVSRFTINTSEADNYLRSLMDGKQIRYIWQLFDDDRREVLQYMLGEEYAQKYIAWLHKLPSIPYTSGYYRRPVRSDNAGLHYTKALDNLKDFLAIVASGLPLEVLMEGGRTEEERAFIGDINFHHLMSVEIDAGNTAVIEKTKDIICSDNNAGRISYSLLQGIVMSNNRELYELEGKLLLAARLQEGLHQSIAETMDSGTVEAFVYLFNIMRTNDMQRFSSVKRAVGTWTGLLDENNADRINQKVMDLIYMSLTDPSYADACLNSEDSIELYMALWSKGFHKLEDLTATAEQVMEEGVKHKVQVLFYYLLNIQAEWMQEQLSKQALERFSGDFSIVVSFLRSYLASVSIGYYYPRKKEDHSYFDSLSEAKKQYYILKDINSRLTKKLTFSPFIFPWHSTELTHEDILEKMASIIYVVGSDELLDDLCTCYEQAGSNVRAFIVKELLKQPASQIQVDTLVKALGDRADSPRSAAFEILDKQEISDDQYLKIEELLKYKSGVLRQQAIKLLMKRGPEALSGTIARLLSAPLADKRLAALDMLLTLRKKGGQAEVCDSLVPLVSSIEKPSSKELLLIEQLIVKKEESSVYTKENGFGLYDPSTKVQLPVLSVDEDFNMKEVFSLFQEGSLIKKLFGRKQQGAYEIIEKLNNLIAANANYEYRAKYGSTYLLNDYFTETDNADKAEKELDKYPLAGVWRNFYKEEVGSFEILFQLAFLLNTDWNSGDSYWNWNSVIDKSSPVICPFYGFDLSGLKKRVNRLPYLRTVNHIINLLIAENRNDGYVRKVANNILVSFSSVLNEKNLYKLYDYKNYQGTQKYTIFSFQDRRISTWMSNSYGWSTDEEFVRHFTVRYHFYNLARYFQTDEPSAITDSNLLIYDFAKMYEMGLLPASEVMKELMVRKKADDNIGTVSSLLCGNLTVWQRRQFKPYEDTGLEQFKDLARKVIDRILDIELKRGDTPTEVSHLALKLEYVEGAVWLVRILKAFGKDTFGRSGYYYNSSYTKKEVLSKLLRCCYPSKTDNAAVLTGLLKNSGITETRLVETAMYAPQWLEIIEQCIGWKALTSTAFYFHAHINEWCDDKKKAIIARYTPIEPEDLRLGAFDIDWFREAYKEIGEKRFEVVYNAAKYISSSNGHTRARKYADAVNGKLITSEVKKQIEEKRNKDLLMAYCLIPLAKKATPDLLERYQYLQQFLKESKAFGAQRQDSEKKAVEIGMQNLARNAGYSDVTRLIWSMETELIKEMEPYFTPVEIEGVQVYVSIDEEGKSDLKLIKGSKELNSVPAKLKKNAYLEELKAVHKKLKNQYSRSRLMLEQAMEDETPFYISELETLTHNPVIWPLLRNLVFVSKDDTGFYLDKNLVTPDGECISQKASTPVRIAHPVDLYTRNVWHRYQQCLFEKGIRQPFKQVFRELYVKTDEERPMFHSLRYAGNQIQPQKTVAVLKGRRWVANYEDGLQKIYYKENIVASIYALADWFSPADIEAPALEWVAFHSRKTYEPIAIEKIPEVIFSEVMRDVDLAVSVAHAGGVDPEASHSTVEMRRAILEFTLPLFKLSNVRLEGSHAFVEGTLGNYNIHLGSGVIHQQAGAAINVLPVHSQQRGRLFLPFVDEDPKTAEIVSKILLFAEDKKIKDPFILDQIKIR
ncbi:DUF4132 domain-containing protein [Parabacteroides hominis]|uniref:DUF4132 domain-containing protein n=1 Tax=Parabacteroides hominis TaxID=2763057 RepID=A0ABR7DNT2_9BACT|nr:DUF4132 domain-containing protein [Parabacteroides hominis]MBC5633037.1 DUF4132 domain-containing protein [Parabacteroides hominis]